MSILKKTGIGFLITLFLYYPQQKFTRLMKVEKK